MAENTDTSTEGWSNLHHAVAGRFTDLIQSLLEQKEEEIVNVPDGQGRTPLHLACSVIKRKDYPPFLKCENEDLTCLLLTETGQIIELLLSHGADPQMLDNNGKSSLHCLVDNWLEKQYPLEEFGKIITLFGYCRGNGNINVKDGEGRTLLHYVAGSPKLKVPVAKTKFEEDMRNRIRRDRELLEGIVPVYKANTIPKYTTEQELFWKEFLIILLSSGADVNVADNEGNTALHLAIIAGKFGIVKELLRREVNINVKNNVGQTPLHLAVSDYEYFKHCAILFLHKGALANIEDIYGNTPVDIARDRQDFPCFLRHLILLIHVKMHPAMVTKIIYRTRHNLGNESASFKKECMQECKDLNSYFQLQGKSQLPIFLQYHSYPCYTKNDFFLTKINCGNFKKRFPNYSHFLKYKFLQDQNRLEMIDRCTNVFSCFGGMFHYTSAGRLMYTRNSHWEVLPMELKLKILSYLSNNELEYLKNLT